MNLAKRFNDNLKLLNLHDTAALKLFITKIFEKYDHQDDVIIDLYKLVFPEWDSIKKLNNHPVCGQELWMYICDLFINFDKKYHPKCMAGGAWINFGFSSGYNLAPWEISLSNCSITYSEAQNVEHTDKRTSGQDTKVV
jgi:hypothetical protein